MSCTHLGEAARMVRLFKRSAVEHVAATKPVTAAVAKQLIKSGKAPANLQVTGKLGFADDAKLEALPPGLTVGALDLSNCVKLAALPPGLRARRLVLSGDWNPQHLLGGLRCYELDLKNTKIESLPADLSVEYRLDLEGCRSLLSLPEGLKVGSLILRECVWLEALPEGLDVYFLDISGCTRITRWPDRGRIEVGRLAARG